MHMDTSMRRVTRQRTHRRAPQPSQLPCSLQRWSMRNCTHAAHTAHPTEPPRRWPLKRDDRSSVHHSSVHAAVRIARFLHPGTVPSQPTTRQTFLRPTSDCRMP